MANFYKAQSVGDLNALLASVLPENVRRMTDTDLVNVKKQVSTSQIKAQGLQF